MRPAPPPAPPGPVRVHFVVSGLARAGTELRLLEIARRAPTDIAAHVCVTSEPLTLRPAFEDAGAAVSVVPVARPWTEWSAVRQVAREVAAARPHVINAFDLKGLILASVARRLVAPRARLVYHVVNLHSELRPSQAFVLWRLMRRADVVICESQNTRDEVIGERPLDGRVVVIPNGVDAEHFASDPGRRADARAALGYADDDFVLGTVANFRPEKNYELLVAGFRRLRERHPRMRLLCVGGGELFDRVRALVDGHGLADRVTLTGSVADVRPYLAAMDAFALCSHKDAFPNAVLQAMSTGLPTLCSRTGEFQTVMADGQAGLLFDAHDVDGFVATVDRVVADPGLRERLARTARRTIEERYTVTTMVERYADCFRALASAAAPPRS